MKKTTYQLITHVLCPYVQRSIITLQEKGVAYKRQDIDLSNKPRWFIEGSPMGKVPALIVDENRWLFESAVICEYLDETTQGSLHPTDPLEKAYHRSWIEFGSNILNDIGGLYNAKVKTDFDVSISKISKKFQMIESQIKSTPYFSGEKFHLIDTVYAPIFRYFEIFDKFVDLAIFTSLPKITLWRTNLMKRKSVIHAVSKQYPDLLLDFLKKRNSYISKLILDHNLVVEP